MRRLLSDFRSYASLSLHVIRINVQSAMEYRISFITQVVGMLVNDIALVCLWYIFFKSFPNVNGWTFRDNMQLLSLSTITYGVLLLLGRGAFDISRYINRGDLDYFLSLPRNVLWQITLSKTDISAIGDLIFGITIFWIFVGNSIFHFLYLLAMSTVSAAILYSFVVLTQALTFYFGNLEDAADQAFWATFTFSFYPQDAFHGWLKAIMFTVLPGFFIASMPMELLREHRTDVLLLLLAFCVLLFTLAVQVFNRGLLRYESGNGINVRV